MSSNASANTKMKMITICKLDRKDVLRLSNWSITYSIISIQKEFCCCHQSQLRFVIVIPSNNIDDNRDFYQLCRLSQCGFSVTFNSLRLPFLHENICCFTRITVGTQDSDSSKREEKSDRVACHFFFFGSFLFGLSVLSQLNSVHQRNR